MGIKVDQKKKEVILTLNPKIYDLLTVREAAKDFGKVAKFLIKKDKFIEIKLQPKLTNMLPIIGYEFCNYILGSMKNKGVV